MKLIRLMMLALSIALLHGCANRMPVGIDYCQTASAIYWTDDAELKATPMPITRQVVRENEKWARLCGG